MEHTKIEVVVLQEATEAAADVQLRELNELQLALVGGGVGEISPY